MASNTVSLNKKSIRGWLKHGAEEICYSVFVFSWCAVLQLGCYDLKFQRSQNQNNQQARK